MSWKTAVSITLWIQPIKGTWSRDGLELSWHAWVYLGLRKGCGRFLIFLDVSIPDKTSFIFLWVNAKSTPLDYTSGVYVIASLSFLLVSAAGLWIPLAGRMRKFYAGIFDQWSIVRCLVFVGHLRQATKFLSAGNDSPHAISYGCQKRYMFYLSVLIQQYSYRELFSTPIYKLYLKKGF